MKTTLGPSSEVPAGYKKPETHVKFNLEGFL